MVANDWSRDTISTLSDLVHVPMNTKSLTSYNGPLLQITLTPWEVSVLQSVVKLASVPSVTDLANAEHGCETTLHYANNQSVGIVMRDFYKALNKLKEK